MERKAIIAKAVKEHAADLLRAARGLGFAQADAEELVGETYAAFLDALDRFEGRSTLKTFLFGILYNKSLEARRRSSRELAVDPADAAFESHFAPNGGWKAPPKGPEDEAQAAEAARFLQDCLDRLPERQRAAFALKEISGEPSPAVCNVLAVDDTHLRVLLFRARTRLRDCIESRWGIK